MKFYGKGSDLWLGSFTKQIGDIGVSAAIYEFQKYGIPIALPFDDNMPYDLIIYANDQFYKVQVKTTLCVKNDEYMEFQTNITNPFKKTYRTYKKDEVDYFFLYCIENEWKGLISFEEYSHRKIITVRYNVPSNNNAIGVIFAEQIQFSVKVLQYFKKELIKPTSEQKQNISGKEICPICNVNYKTKKAKMCVPCYNTKRKENIIPHAIHRQVTDPTKYWAKNRDITRDELKQLVRSKPFTQIAKDYGVSDNAIRKWCKRNNIPWKKGEIIKYTDEEWASI